MCKFCLKNDGYVIDNPIGPSTLEAHQLGCASNDIRAKRIYWITFVTFFWPLLMRSTRMMTPRVDGSMRRPCKS